MLNLLRKYRWAPTAIVWFAVVWLTLAPNPLPGNQIKLFEGADKIVHGLMFFTLTICGLADISDWKRIVSLKNIYIITICVLIFAALDEWMQNMMGLGRTSDFYDFTADCAGILTAVILILLIRKKD